MTNLAKLYSDRSTRTEMLVSAALLLMALSFAFLMPFTHQLFAPQWNMALLKDHVRFAQLMRENMDSNIAAMAAFLLSMSFWMAAFQCRKNSASITGFLRTRKGAAILIFSMFLCQMGVCFTRSMVDSGDAVAHINSSREVLDNVSLGEWPYYTFRYSNGCTIGLQYPPLNTYLESVFDFIDRGRPDLNYSLTTAATQLLLTIGIYRFLRVWGFERFSCAIVTLTISGCHQMLLYNTISTNATYLAVAIATWASAAFVRWLRSHLWRHAIIFGLWFAFGFLAHPVITLFLGYFLFPVAFFHFCVSNTHEKKLFLAQSLASAWAALVPSAPYLASYSIFRADNSFTLGSVTIFVDKAAKFQNNFLWLFKYVLSKNGTGEYISLLLFVGALAGLWLLARDLARNKGAAFTKPYYGLFAMVFFVCGAAIFYARDTALILLIPGIKLSKVYNRLFIFYALGIALLAVRPLSALVRGKRGWIVALLAILLFLEQFLFWIRPAYRSLPEDVRLNPADFSLCDPKTACFFSVMPDKTAGNGFDEDVDLRRMGFAGIGVLYVEEMSAVGNEAYGFRKELKKSVDADRFDHMIHRLRWMRVTHMVWQRPEMEGVDFKKYGNVTPITNGLLINLDAPVMDRETRSIKLHIVPEDVLEGSKMLLPVGFSSFLHCRRMDRPEGEIPLVNFHGRALIEDLLPVGTGLVIEAVTPRWLSILSWFSLLGTVTLVAYLVISRRRIVT